MQCFLSVMILENKLFMTYENGYNFQKISWGHIKGEGIDLLFCGKTIVNILKFLDVAKREKGGFALNFREHWKRNELRCLPFHSSKSFFFVIILVHVVTQQSLHTTPGSQGMFLLLVVSFTPTWHWCLDENVRLTTISVKKGFQYSSFLQIVILKNDFCSIVNSLMVVKKVIRTLTNLQLKASGLIIQSNYLRWRLHLLTTNVNHLNVSYQYFEDMPYFWEKQMWTGFVKA